MKNLLQIICSLLLCLTISQAAVAEGGGKGGDAFRDTAASYDAKAEKFAGKGMSEAAAIYKQMAGIKRHAAELGDQNRWDEIDWNEYHALEQQVGELTSKQRHKK